MIRFVTPFVTLKTLWTDRMIAYAIAYLFTALVFLAVDLLWLSKIARSFYVEQIGDLLLSQPRLGVATAFYLVYIAGIVAFAVAPALKADSLLQAAFLGAFFGFVAYATYDLTNYSTLKDWPVAVTVVDICWGTILTAVSAVAGFQATRVALRFFQGSI